MNVILALSFIILQHAKFHSCRFVHPQPVSAVGYTEDQQSTKLTDFLFPLLNHSVESQDLEVPYTDIKESRYKKRNKKWGDLKELVEITPLRGKSKKDGSSVAILLSASNLSELADLKKHKKDKRLKKAKVGEEISDVHKVLDAGTVGDNIEIINGLSAEEEEEEVTAKLITKVLKERGAKRNHIKEKFAAPQEVNEENFAEVVKERHVKEVTEVLDEVASETVEDTKEVTTKNSQKVVNEDLSSQITSETSSADHTEERTLEASGEATVETTVKATENKLSKSGNVKEINGLTTELTSEVVEESSGDISKEGESKSSEKWYLKHTKLDYSEEYGDVTEKIASGRPVQYTEAADEVKSEVQEHVNEKMQSLVNIGTSDILDESTSESEIKVSDNEALGKLEKVDQLSSETEENASEVPVEEKVKHTLANEGSDEVPQVQVALDDDSSQSKTGSRYGDLTVRSWELIDDGTREIEELVMRGKYVPLEESDELPHETREVEEHTKDGSELVTYYEVIGDISQDNSQSGFATEMTDEISVETLKQHVPIRRRKQELMEESFDLTNELTKDVGSRWGGEPKFNPDKGEKKEYGFVGEIAKEKCDDKVDVAQKNVSGKSYSLSFLFNK